MKPDTREYRTTIQFVHFATSEDAARSRAQTAVDALLNIGCDIREDRTTHLAAFSVRETPDTRSIITGKTPSEVK